MATSSDNFFQLIIDFKAAIDLANMYLLGTETDTFEMDGEVRSSVAKVLAEKLATHAAEFNAFMTNSNSSYTEFMNDSGTSFNSLMSTSGTAFTDFMGQADNSVAGAINQVVADIDSKWSAIQALVDSSLVFETKAQLDAYVPTVNSNGQYPVAKVWRDSDEFVGLYGYSSGTWIKSPYDITGFFNTKIAYIYTELFLKFAQYSQQSGFYQQHDSSDDVIPFITDENGKIAIGFHKSKGTLIASELNDVADELSAIKPIVVDEAGKVALAIVKETGEAFFDPHKSAAKNTLSKIGLGIEDGFDSDSVVYGLSDKDGRLAFAIDKFGDAYFFGNLTALNLSGTSSSAPDEQPVDTSSSQAMAINNPVVDNNHFLFYGQSLSVGAQGKPVLTVSQPYLNKTFIGGPRSALDEVYDFRPLYEDEDTAPDGGTNRGETVCSAAGNYVTTLISSENGLDYMDSGYDLLVSTAGHGGYKIVQLEQGSSWYQYAQAHIQGGYDASQSNGQTYALQAIGWIQGETDTEAGTTRAGYLAALTKLREDLEDYEHSITGNTHTIPLITYQVSYGSTVDDGIALAQVDASKTDNAIFLSTPTYHLPYFTDKTHLTNIGYIWLGHYFAQAYKKIIIDGEVWKPTSPKRIIRQGAIINIEFNVPQPPLVIDESTLGAFINHGFSVLNSSGAEQTILSVELSGPNRVRITLSSDIDGVLTVRYGLDHSSSVIYANILNSSGGCLRDSSPNTFDQDGSTYNLWNWCVMFEQETNQ
jgi:hypothetical protein